jgi:amidase
MAGLAKMFFWSRSSAPAIPSLLEISLDDIIAGLERGSFTATDLVTAYIKRAEEVDHIFRSVLQINDDAVSIAQQLDAEAKVSGRRGYVL